MDNFRPWISSEFPGPKARAFIEIDARVTSPSLPRDYPLVADYAKGCIIADVDGNRFLDFVAGIGVCATRQCHPREVSAIQEQAARLIHRLVQELTLLCCKHFVGA